MNFDPNQWSVLEQVPPGDYAMWWTSPEDPLFQNSPVRRYITQAFEALDGIEAEFYASILRSIRFADKDCGFAALPENMEAIPIRESGENIVLLVASREKGIKFHFHITQTPVAFRNEFWRLFAEYATKWSDANAIRPFDWWVLCEEASLTAESVGGPVTVGKVGWMTDKSP